MRMPMLALLAAVLVLAPTLAQAVKCADGWRDYNLFSSGSCYLFVKERMTWQAAKNKCWEEEAMLVSLHEEAENSFVANDMMMAAMTDAWTGGILKADGAFSWQSGEVPADNWARWSTDEPNSYQGGSHVVISSNPMSFGKWRDETGENKFFFICERPPESTLQTGVTTRKAGSTTQTTGTTTQPPATQSPPTQPANAVGDCFTKMANTQAHVADQFAGIDVLDDCLKKCIGIGCKSLDWDAKNPAYNNVRCWIYKPPRRVMANETNPITGVDHYDFIEGTCGV